MTQPAPAAAPRRSTWQALRDLGPRRTVAMMVLGFSAGLPILLVFSTLSAWLAVSGVSRTAIGFFAWAGLAYSFKFLWAPLADRLRIPLLDRLVGRRRAWLLVAQAGVIGAILLAAGGDPAEDLQRMAVASVLIAFFSATQDIALDAWRIDVADDRDQALMSAIYQWGYRFGLILAGAGALWIADLSSFRVSYTVMAVAMLAGPIGVLVAVRPPRVERAGGGLEAVSRRMGGSALGRFAAWLYGAVAAPFVDFFQRHAWLALFVLALIGLYRLTDFVLGFMANPFYLDLGYSLSQIAAVSKFYGIWVTLLGALVAGIVATRYSVYPVLLAGAILGAGSNLAFFWLALQQGPGIAELVGAISIENFSGGWAGTALIAYMSSLTNRAFSATQYALFSSFYALPGKLFGGVSGAMVDAWGFPLFYLVTALIGLPAILLAWIAVRSRRVRDLAQHSPRVS